MNYTSNFHLPIWEKTDRIRMEDFNAMTVGLENALAAEQQARQSGDNAGSGALAAEQQARQSGDAAEASARSSAVANINARMNLLGNCIIATVSYTGTGTYGYDNPTTHTFVKPPIAVFWGTENGSGVSLRALRGQTMVYVDSGADFPVTIRWQGNSVSLIHSQSASGQFNNLNAPYRIVALLAANE